MLGMFSSSASAQHTPIIEGADQDLVSDLASQPDEDWADGEITGPLASQGVQSIATGGNHTCAISGRGNVWCWGNNNLGQLGDGTTEGRNVPTRVVGLTGRFVQVSAGMHHSCALSASQRVFCWGGNYWQQLGIGPRENQDRPVRVVGLRDNVVSLSAGKYHTCIVNTHARVICWGANYAGQL
ncbi:hypothetical protein [Pararhodobacter sp. CCB-MM2]|uniref:RCC1 domain-containing protein n=1 Tax=Pararhodobacter sp. CCB-MM2 TaxID=1786003 RepID=UPI0009F4585F|nr:hypothetical protein [Pararhodobacter sp. CCB-MM2]